MTDIMNKQVEIALQNRTALVPSQTEHYPANTSAIERSKVRKPQDSLQAECKKRTHQILDDRKRKFNSLDADAKEVTGWCFIAQIHETVSKKYHKDINA